MGTTIRPEISKKSDYWLSRHRYYELKHFCMQYPEWKKARDCLDGFTNRVMDVLPSTDNHGDPTSRAVASREYFSKRIEMVEHAAISTDEMIGTYILTAVTQGLSYTYLRMNLNIPCSKGTYYELYRKFFYILSAIRN